MACPLRLRCIPVCGSVADGCGPWRRFGQRAGGGHRSGPAGVNFAAGAAALSPVALESARTGYGRAHMIGKNQAVAQALVIFDVDGDLF